MTSVSTLLTTVGFANSPDDDGEGRLVAGLAPIALDRLEDRGLLAADVRTRPLAHLDVERESLTEHVVSEIPAPPRFGQRSAEHMVRVRILTAQVDEPLVAIRCVGRDRHRLDQRERVSLHDHPVLERAGLGLVGVADQVMRACRLPCHRLPFHTCRERGAAPALKLRVLELTDDALGPELERAPQRGVTAVRTVLVEARGLGAADAAQQAQALVALLRHGGSWSRRRLAAGEQSEHVRRRGRRGDAFLRVVARHRQHCGRSPVALAEARAAIPGRGTVVGKLALPAEALLDLRDQILGAVAAAGEVLADVDDARGSRLHREQCIERGDTVGVCRRDRQTRTDVIEASGADPADSLLQRPQRRQQQVPATARLVTALRGVAGRPVAAVASLPAVLRRPEHAVDRCPLGLRLDCSRNEVNVHRLRVCLDKSPTASGSWMPDASACSAGSSFSTRIAAALNSAVPDFGSVASIVSWFVST